MLYYPSRIGILICEPLERRCLLSAEWGAIPKLIRQDLAVETFAQFSGAGQTVAVIDTGIDYNHPHLGGGFGPGFKVVAGYDFVDDDDDPMDTFGHGTYVAGVIAASPFQVDGKLYQGIAPEAKLVALRVDSADQPVPATRIEQALQWVLEHRTTYNIVAVNISFGSGKYDNPESSAVYGDELFELKEAGVFVAAASGNGGVSDSFGIQYPAADPNVFSVGSVDRFDRISEFTSRGNLLDYLAPGEVVTTTGLNGNFALVSGTSFGTPMVAGAVAVLNDVDPSLDVADVRSILRAAGKDNFDGDDEFGRVTEMTFPRLDLYNAVALALARRPGPLSASGELNLGGGSAGVQVDRDGVTHIVWYDPVENTFRYATRSTAGMLANSQVIDNSDLYQGQFLSLQLDASGRPAVAYFDGMHGDLKFARFDGQTWNIELIDWRGSVGLYPSLVFKNDGNPLISYYRKTGGELRIADFDGVNWSIMRLDSAGDVGRSTSMAITSNGKIAIAYEHSGHGVLKVAQYDGSSWSLSVADPTTRGLAFISLAFTNDNRPAVSYYDAWPADLKYTVLTDNGWQHEIVAWRGAVGLYTNLHFDIANRASIVYYSRRGDLLMSATKQTDGWAYRVLQEGGGRFASSVFVPTQLRLVYVWHRSEDATMRVSEA